VDKAQGVHNQETADMENLPRDSVEKPVTWGSVRLLLDYVTAVGKMADAAVMEVAALKVVLIDKGLFTPEELTAAMAEIQATLAVEQTLSPELQALEDEWNRILETNRPEEPTDG
jgi:hypothetical protein